MRDCLSLRIVNFIGGLHPLYERVLTEQQFAARCLLDGTMIYPIEEDEDDEDGYVLVHWQGDSQRSCKTSGQALATLAVAKYAELRAIPWDKRTKPEYESMAHHFEVKTGGSLHLELADPDAQAYELLGQLLRKGGTAAAVELLKKAAGL